MGRVRGESAERQEKMMHTRGTNGKIRRRTNIRGYLAADTFQLMRRIWDKLTSGLVPRGLDNFHRQQDLPLGGSQQSGIL